jgi:acyl-[acyl-carrier-protein]-phospholipid O-acyltransferase/long-chain-fatty-acid--[acyl-carrier-protein] ligase
MARTRPGMVVFEDVTMTSLSFKKLIVGADLISRAIDRIAADGSRRLGILLPNVNANPVTLLASWFAGRVPTVFNYTSGPAVMLQCARLAGIRHVISSRTFLEKAGIDISSLQEAGIEFHFLEDLRRTFGLTDKLAALFRFRFEPDIIDRGHWSRGDTAIILFTSGSEGVPKGVQLTHGNFIANVEQVLAVTDINDTDRIFNPLPLFHSFGLTIGAILPMMKGIYTFLFPNPLNYRGIPSVVYDLNCTVTMGTNTFLSNYARYAHPMDFRKIRYLVAGAEKLQDSTFDLWNEKFGVRILQGYGATETAPVVSVNTFMFHRKGTTGMPLPGLEVRIEPVDGVERGGRVMVKGPNVMKGYLNPEPDEKFKALGGWYDTGDIGELDDEGYLRLLGRLKRFAKISGEMVSLTAVEEALANELTPRYGEDFHIAVVSVPDEAKGEKLIAYSTLQDIDPVLVREAIQKAGLSTLCIPRELRFIEEIPALGTGKVDHKTLSTIAANS